MGINRLHIFFLSERSSNRCPGYAKAWNTQLNHTLLGGDSISERKLQFYLEYQFANVIPWGIQLFVIAVGYLLTEIVEQRF